MYTLEELMNTDNQLCELSCWSCRFITETDRDNIMMVIKNNNYDIHLSWYPFTGEEAPMPLDDIDIESEDEEESFEDDEEDEDHEFLNYWNNPPLPGRALGCC